MQVRRREVCEEQLFNSRTILCPVYIISIQIHKSLDDKYGTWEINSFWYQTIKCNISLTKGKKISQWKTVTGTNGIISYGRMHLNCFTLKLAGQDFIYIHKNISLFRLHNALTCWKWIFRFWYGLISLCLPL